MRRFAPALALTVACATLGRPPEPDRRLQIHTHGELFESSAGYRFVALPEPAASVVRVMVRYPVGSADDPPGKEGLAHLVEHLLFDVEIPRKDAVTSISAELGRLSIGHNAHTAEDHTDYETIAPPEALPELLALEADRLGVGCAGLTPEIFERERAVVMAELRERRGPTGSEVFRALKEQIYPAGHPYRSGDTPDTVASLTLKDACDFLAGPYLEGTPVVTASGAVDGVALRRAGAAFAHAHARRTSPRAIVPEAPVVTGTTHVPAGVDVPTLVVTWPLPQERTRDYRLLEMVWPLIPRLLERQAHRFSWGHQADIFVVGGSRAPALVLTITLASASKAKDATDALPNALDLAERAVGEDTESPAWRSRWQAFTESLLASWESLGTRNELVADLLDEGASGGLIVDRVDELVHATPKETRELAHRWLDPARAHVVVFEPNGSAGSQTRARYTSGGEETGVAVDGSLADRPLPIPKTHLALDTDHYRLANGLELVMWSGGTSPLVHGRLIVRGGTAQEPAGMEGISDLTGATTTPDTLEFSDRELSTRVDDLVDLLGAPVRGMAYELTDEARREIRGLVTVQSTRERASYNRDVLAAVYGEGHPYAHGEMSADSLDRITRDGAIKWAHEHVTPRRSVMIVTGSFSPGILEKLAKFTLDHVSGGHAPEPPPPAPRESLEARVVRGVTAKPAATLHLDVAFVGPPGLDASHAKRLVLVAVLNSRLEALRGEKALTYGVYASYYPLAAGGLWSISGDVDPARADEAARAIEQILADIRANPESYRSEFVLAREKVLAGMLAGVADSGAIADRLAQLARFDLPDDFYDRLARDVAALTLSDLHAFAATELVRDHEVFGVFGNKAAVDAAAGAVTAR